MLDAVEDVTGFRSPLFGFLFDNAVVTFGRWVENKIMETDDNGNRLHDLHAVLEAAPGPSGADAFIAMMESTGLYRPGGA